MFLENNMNKLVILFVIGIILLVGINSYKSKIGDQCSVVLFVLVVVVCGYFGYILLNDVNDVNDVNDMNRLNDVNDMNDVNVVNDMNEMNEMNEMNGMNDMNNVVSEGFNDYESFSPTDGNRESGESGESGVLNEDVPTTSTNEKHFEAEALLPRANVEMFDGGAPTTSHDNTNPNTPGDVMSNSLLNAGHHIGVNTTGCSMRNANRGLRSEPPNPQTQVSPWLQTTICPDLYRKPLDCPN